MQGFSSFWVVLLVAVKLGLAAPSIEACPPDSLLIDNSCICNPESCTQPPCLFSLEMASNGTEIPGSCCPVYSCEGCKNESLLDGKCPCAPGAILNDKGICECVDKEHHLVDGKCVCNPQQCELPKICDRKSVLTTIEDGCCRKTRCVPCPPDSESTNLDTDELDDHCVCLPCISECGINKTLVVKKKGTGFPGNCCDLYECQPNIEEKYIDCVVGDIIYNNGEEWSTVDKQHCTCKNGISLCATKHEEVPKLNCWDEDVMYKHNETWLKDKGCTFCQCLDGEHKCISHYCDSVKESEISINNDSSPCFREKISFENRQSWTEADGCTVCICLNGQEKCDSKCNLTKEVPPQIGECHPLFNCNKQCPNGFRINKKGCEICKCNPAKSVPDLLSQYNITYNGLLNILDTFQKSKTSTSLPETSTDSNDIKLADIESVPSVIMSKRNGELREKTTSPETMITPAYLPQEDHSCWIIIAALAALIAGIIAGTVGFCLYRNKRKYSVTPSRGSYHSVINSATDNNNTIKKNSIRFENE